MPQGKDAWRWLDRQYLLKAIEIAEELEGDSEEIDAIISLLNEMKNYSAEHLGHISSLGDAVSVQF